MPIGRGQFSSLLKPDLYRVYMETGKERPLEYPEIFNVADMPWSILDDRQISGLGTLQSMPEGEQFTLDQPVVGSTKQYEAEPFGLAVEITYPMWKDDLYGVMRELVAELARSSRNKQEVEAWSVLNNAFDTSYTGFNSGESLCDTSHELINSTSTVANRPTTDVTLSVLGVQNAIIRFEDMVNESGLPRLFAPTKALVSTADRYVAREIFGSSGKPYTTDNEHNAIIQDDLGWMVCHYFTNSNQWFLTAAKGQHDLNFFWRDRPIFDVFDDPWTKNAVATVYQRHTKGFGSWRGIDGSKIS